MAVILSMELPRPGRTRRALMVALTCAAVVVDGLSTLMLHATLGDGAVAQDMRRWLAQRDLALPAALLAATLAALLTGLGYLSTLDWRQRRRPWGLLMGLGMGGAAVLLAPVLGVLSFPAEQPAVLGAAVVAAIGVAGTLRLLEWLVGRFLSSVSGLAAAAKSPGAAWWARWALCFVPRDVAARRSLGLGLVLQGRMEEGYPHLIAAYGAGDRLPPLLRALAETTEAAGELTTALSHLEELAGILPEDEEVLAQRIRLLRLLGRPADARALIEALPPERFAPWRETRIELLLELGDCPALKAEAGLFEAEQGPPFPRARQILRQVHCLAPDAPEYLEELIRLADLSGDSDDLVALLREHIERHPGQVERVRQLRHEHLRRGEAEAAQKQLEELARLDGVNVEECVELAGWCERRGDDAGVTDYLGRLEGAPGRTPAGAVMMMRLLHVSGRHEEALAHGRRAREEGWVAGTSLQELATIEGRIHSQNLTEALAELGRAAAEQPDDIDVQFRYLQRLCEAGQTDKAVLLAEEVLDRHGAEVQGRLEEELARCATLVPQGRSGRLVEYLGDLRLRAGDADGALSHYRDASRMGMRPAEALLEMVRRLLASQPGHVAGHLEAAALEHGLGDSRGALRHIDAAIEAGHVMEPGSETQLLEFRAASRVGAAERAIAAGRGLVESPAHRDDVALHLDLAEQLVRYGDYDGACTLLEALLEREPDNMTVRGRLRQAAERRKLARIERLKTELARHPRSPHLLEELGDLLLADAKLNEAVVEFQKAAHLGPENRTARAKLGLCLARKGLHAEAEEAFIECGLTPGLAPEELIILKDLFYDGALIMEKDRESDRALSIYKCVSKVDMGFRDVLARIERLSRSQKRKTL